MVERLHVRNEYEPAIQEARKAFAKSKGVRAVFGGELKPKEALTFLLNFSSMGVEMTRPVDHWIRTAGKRCVDLGYGKLGKALCDHAKHEAGHHKMMVSDTHFLVDRWNQDGFDPLDARVLLARPMTEAVRQYAILHEEVIASDAPL